jgi:Toprim-like
MVSAGLVDELHSSGSIYANSHRPNPSLAFLHRDLHGEVRGATLRDTKHQSAFRPCLGSKLTAWFAVGNLAKASRVVAVESPIDALSYYSLFGLPDDSLAVVSCAGAIVPRALMSHAHDRRQAFVVALDNDFAGERGCLKARHETVDWTDFNLSSARPKHKDWNEDLIAAVRRLRTPKLKNSASLKL